MKIKLLLAIIYVLAFSGYIFSQNNWINTGGPEGGAILELVEFDGKLFGRTAYNIYVSDDGGGSWSKLDSGTVKNATPQSMVATSFGVHFKSTDVLSTTYDGKTTEKTTNGFGAFDIPTYIVTVEDTLFATTASGIFKSTDGGQNWAKFGSFSALEVPHSANGQLFAASLLGGLKLSTDGGATFNSLGTGLGSAFVTNVVVMGDKYVANSNMGAWYLNDENTWTKSFDVPGGFGSITSLDGKIYGLYSSPQLAAELHVSADTGKTWSKVEIESETAPIFGDHNKVVQIGGKLYATAITKSNPLVSTDEGLNWESLGTAGLQNPRIEGIFTFGSTIFVTTNDGAGTAQFGNGVFRSLDSGETWEKLDMNLPDGHNSSFYTIRKNGDDLYAGSFAGLFKSSDNGDTWSVVAGTETWYISDIYFGDGVWAMAGGDGFSRIWTSADGGANWEAQYQGIGAVFERFSATDDAIVIGSNTALIASSVDGGTNWRFSGTDQGLALIAGSYLDVVPLGSNWYTFGSAQAKIYESTDGGENWAEVSGLSFGGALVGAFQRLVSHNDSLFLHGSTTAFVNGAFVFSNKLFYSVDGTSFEEYVSTEGLAEGYSNPSITFSEEGALYVGYSGSQVFKYGAESMGTPNEQVELHPERFMLSQNYPNPFNPSTNIAFNLPSAGEVSLKVYNLLGQEVATLIDGKLGSGSHTVSFNASQLTSGMYIYRFQTRNHLQTKKMMLIK